MTPETLSEVLRESARIKTQLADEQAGAILEVIEAVIAALARGNTVFFFGNGGSAADAQHLAAELIGRFTLERRPLPALALTTDTSILTSIGNDYGFDQIFLRQIQGLGRPGDVAVGLSTSGNSPNVLKAVEAARANGLITVAMTGEGGGRLADRAHFCLRVPATDTARIQESHITIGHLVCQGVDEAVAEGRIPQEAGNGNPRA
ncbi:Phosphoheptose isomerase 1 [Thioalkalivibrio nitratireducens DSM 14787]|uniref:Phosphoheptose isomerase n=1 Tax=Thioalkalivibrio nitratireducens (strain DSM 14787 / UNIQEM 213 / ALEN2) TaxID=1255043 RepID=L0DXM8_THIND|nr:D-sedoheptulose 7-phosphate isomerase [Thioalkalivibrio nitratireducens]AGA34339.1 Phosphoheptose isomerase 1 [Thioalkalivibrio nitratireducens DSM 14787]